MNDTGFDKRFGVGFTHALKCGECFYLAAEFTGDLLHVPHFPAPIGNHVSVDSKNGLVRG
jgi:hypothetical protein